MPRPNDHDDQQLLQRIAEGDSAALRELHVKTARPLHSMAMKILTSSAEAEEVIQDVFVLVWKNAHKFNFEKAKVFTWMAVMMKNRCIDRIRAKKRRIPLYEVDDYTESSITQPNSKNAVDILKQKEKASIVLEAVKQLPDPQREVIELVFYKEMTHVQVAEHLDISIGTAKSRIRYAYQRLRDSLSNNSNLDRN